MARTASCRLGIVDPTHFLSRHLTEVRLFGFLRRDLLHVASREPETCVQFGQLAFVDKALPERIGNRAKFRCPVLLCGSRQNRPRGNPYRALAEVQFYQQVYDLPRDHYAKPPTNRGYTEAQNVLSLHRIGT